MKDGKFLTIAFESSCDETSVAVVADGREVLSNVISTQIEIHKQYGGVVPEIASRHHLENINAVTEQALSEAGVAWDDIDIIGVTKGPGLVGALLIGIATAKAFALAKNKPLVGVHHIQGHISANYIAYKELEPPFTALIISGGHTTIAEVTDYNECRVLGQTRDDAAGEAFDKVARVIGLGYPGGPLIDKLAKEGNPHAVEFKRVYLEKDSLDFSFSGIKTGVLNYINSEKQAGREIAAADIAASFQQAVLDVVVDKAMSAAMRGNAETENISRSEEGENRSANAEMARDKNADGTENKNINADAENTVNESADDAESGDAGNAEPKRRSVTASGIKDEGAAEKKNIGKSADCENRDAYAESKSRSAVVENAVSISSSGNKNINTGAENAVNESANSGELKYRSVTADGAEPEGAGNAESKYRFEEKESAEPKRKLAVAGGVAANSELRRRLQAAGAENGVAVFCPPPVLCTDNAAMIACAAYYAYKAGVRDDLSLDAYASLPL